MEALKQRRIPLRASFTKAANLLDSELEASQLEAKKITDALAKLEIKGEKLADLEREIELLLQSIACTQREFEENFEAAEVYADRLISSKLKAKRVLARLQGSSSAKEASNGGKRKYRLPELGLKRFSGDLKDWLGFWGQFRKIDEDPEMDAEDKFQYLIQSTVAGSRARELVESFPPTKDSYSKAIECLKSRFGKDDTLVEVYVRELLRLVLNNALNPKQKVALPVLYDRLEAQLRALETLGVTRDKYAAMLYPLVESCLPEDVLRAWEKSRGSKTEGDGKQDNRLTLLMTFLRSEVDGEERISLARTGFGVETELRKKRAPKFSTAETEEIPTASTLLNSAPNQTNVKTEPVCIFCEKLHPSRDCKQALNLPFEERKTRVRVNRCCYVCLKLGNAARYCRARSKIKCAVCDRRHLAVMCPGKSSNVTEHSPPSGSNTSMQTAPGRDSALTNNTLSSDVLLQTLVVRLRGRESQRTVRVLIDSGSQRSYIREDVAAEMGYKELGEKIIVHSLFGGLNSERQVHRIFRVYLSSLDDTYRCNFEVLSQKVICGHIPKIAFGPWLEELQATGIALSDADSGISLEKPYSMEIDLLIGADVLGKLLTSEVFLLKCGPVAVNTRLGWTLMGKVPREPCYDDSVLLTTALLSREEQISYLWKLDSLGITDPVERKNLEEHQDLVLRQFKKTVKLNQEGRYEIALPWTEEQQHLPSNRHIAEKRLRSTCERLKSGGLLEGYQEILEEWLAEDIIEEIPTSAIDDEAHYLPHRAVVKESSATTKLRPVFDASAKQKNSLSLNDCLEKGPNLIDRIPSILTRFRMRRIGVTSDIKRAFLQISVRKEDRDFLRFLWLNNGNDDELRVFRHKRVVFGVCSSPFLLEATLLFHFENAPAHLIEVSHKLRESFYVDNCVTSVNDETELKRFVGQSEELLSLAKFQFHEWRHCYPDNVRAMQINGLRCPSLEQTESSSEDPQLSASVLGLSWNLEEDTLSCQLTELGQLSDGPITKRKILSLAHRVFDPIGFTCPVMLCPKVLLQDCWKLKVKWDDELPAEIAKPFRRWWEQLLFLKTVRVLRWLRVVCDPQPKIEIHTFCDASTVAYACCIFVCSETEQCVSVQLVQARTRVAPTKPVTVRRLELLACSIGARLAKTVQEDLKGLEGVSFHYWTDSANALYWIKQDEAYGVFVGNRVREIRKLTSRDEWRHLPGNANPADLPSRGCSVKRLIELQWWEGPKWLKQPPEEWPKSEVFHDQEVISAEKRKGGISLLNSKTELPWYCRRFSSFCKIVNMIGWIQRFINNSKICLEKLSTGALNVQEIGRAEKILIALIQRESFVGANDERLRTLRPFVDAEGILRVTSRILRREDTDDFRSPAVLPSKHPVISLLIMWRHRALCHAGVQVLMVDLRQNYWILQSRRTIRQVIGSCGRCRRYRAKNVQVVSPPLPKERVQDNAVFTIVGIDLAGPLFLRGGKKAWVVLFTCAVYRAVHLEVVTSLSTETFFQSLRRFIARRGRPSVIYSDNGSNFVGAENAFKTIDWTAINYNASVQKIMWKFIPPTAAWWGGWWERLVGLLKCLLRRVLGRAVLSFEELYTVTCECESVMNTHPLTYISEDSEDLFPLTPAMFLQDVSNSDVGDIDTVDRTCLSKRARYIQKLRRE